MKQFKARAVVSCSACKGDMRSSLIAGQGAGTEPPAPAAEESSDGDSLRYRLAQALKDLPPMPQAFDQALGLMADMHSSPADIAQVLEASPAVSARVLRLAGMSL